MKKIENVEINSEIEKPKKQFKFRYIIFGVIIIFFLSTIISSISLQLSPKIAVVPIKGVITTDGGSSLFSSSISSRHISETLYNLADDSSVKIIVLDINSPGGSPVASEEISKSIEYAKTKKEVIALISDIGASGAFWISVSANKTYASKMSYVGSIGVTSAHLSFENFIKEHNITYRKITAGEKKDIGSIFRDPTKEEEEDTQKLLDEIHKIFIEHIANSRNLSFNYVKKYATGEGFLGSKALEIGFIDAIGNYNDVMVEAQKKTNTSYIVNYSPPKTLAEELGFREVLSFGIEGEGISLQ